MREAKRPSVFSLSVRPGIRCLWQVNGRCNISFVEWMKLDMDYIDHWSLWLDLFVNQAADFREQVKTSPGSAPS